MYPMPTSHGSRASNPQDFSTVWLRVFLAVADSESFTAAAGSLGYTQSAVSRQVAALEQEVG
jgi:DNA-binding transcriptional LysR family regulator